MTITPDPSPAPPPGAGAPEPRPLGEPDPALGVAGVEMPPSETGASTPELPGVDQASRPPRHIPDSRFGRLWVASVAFAVVLVLMLVFILQNLHEARVHFLAWSGSLPLGLALLFAVVSGAAVVLLIGSIRIMQLRRRVKHPGNLRGPPPDSGTQPGPIG